MNLTFLGDIASPSASVSDSLQRMIAQTPEVFKGKKIVCNFEGLAVNQEPTQKNEPLLYNHSSVMDILDGEEKFILCLANNHVLDFPQQFRFTVDLCREKDHLFCGAGLTRDQAEHPCEFYIGKTKIVLFNACWDFLLYNQKNPTSGVYVAEIDEIRLLKKVRQLREREENIRIIVYLHWNLDLETLPFPLHRQFSRDLIKAGVSLVVGAHSHCVQGGEKFGDGYAIYGLGNFLIPNGEYAGGNLSFPAMSSTGLAIEWDPDNLGLICHWFEYKGKKENHLLAYMGSERFEESERLKHYSPYRGMNDSEYSTYFSKNRRKKVLIPIYKDYRQVVRNRFYTFFLRIRARTAHFLATLNLIGWQN